MNVIIKQSYRNDTALYMLLNEKNGILSITKCVSFIYMYVYM